MTKKEILSMLGFHDISLTWSTWSLKINGSYYTIHDIILSNLILNSKNNEQLKREISERMEEL